MPKIKIVSIPEGPDIPEKVREGWLELELEAEGPIKMELSSITNLNEFQGVRWVYEVLSIVAMEALREKNRKAWLWFARAPIVSPYFCFPVECCVDIRLLLEYTGPLKVTIRDVGEFTPDFDPEIVGGPSTLFDYIGHAYACLVTDLDKVLQVETRPSDWRVWRFLPGEKILEVAKLPFD